MAEQQKSEYRPDQIRRCYPTGIDEFYWHRARNWILTRELKKFARKEDPLLEIGCARGFVVKHLRRQGFSCDGVELAAVEPEEEVAAYIRRGIKAEDLPEASRMSYKTLLLLDVIEHIEDPVVFLRSLIDSFPHVSHILITVPARAELWSNYDDYYGHFRRYHPAMMKQLESALPWDLTFTSYFFRVLYFPAFLSAALRWKRSTTVSAPRGPSKLFHCLLGDYLKLEYMIFPRTIPGTSLLNVFKINDPIS